ncbi:MAG TPA: aegerolysin family protein [Thermoanaerobaculia bacterium]|nr:aegerolysin family protein [Thermoanaerobaculia bacterium]
MDTQQAVAEPDQNVGVSYEYLQVRAKMINYTSEEMIITGSDLTWGKWITSPVNVPAKSDRDFASQGRSSSPSGTEGWATWRIGKANIRVSFARPYNGLPDQRITCEPAIAYRVTSSGTQGDVNHVTFTVSPA